MFIRKNNYDKFLQKVRVNVGNVCGLEENEEAYIVLRELDTNSMMKLKKASNDGEEALIDFMHKILPQIIIEHNFYETEQQKMTNEALANLIYDRMELSSLVIKSYTEASFFTPKRTNEDK